MVRSCKHHGPRYTELKSFLIPFARGALLISENTKANISWLFPMHLIQLTGIILNYASVMMTGISWTHEITIDKSDDPANMNDYTAYSDLVKLPSGRVGILYERNNYSEIVFRVIKPGT